MVLLIHTSNRHKSELSEALLLSFSHCMFLFLFFVQIKVRQSMFCFLDHNYFYTNAVSYQGLVYMGKF